MQKYAHLNRDVKNGAIHIQIKKKWVSHIQFSWKKGAYCIPGSAEKGGYSGRTSVPCHIGIERSEVQIIFASRMFSELTLTPTLCN